MPPKNQSLLAFNFFTHPVEFNFDKISKQGHWSGIVGSYIFMVLLFIFTAFFGMDFYTRANPSINKIETSLEDYQATLNKVKNFPVFVYSLHYKHHHRVGTYFYENGKYQKISRQCTEKELAEFDFAKQDFSRYYCVDVDKIEMDEKQLSSFYFIDCASLNLLGLNKTDWGFSNCPVLTEQDVIDINSYFIYFYSPKVKLEMNNYGKPISFYYESTVSSLKVKQLMVMKIKMTFVEVKDDKGWIFKSESSHYGVRFDTSLESILDFYYDSFYNRNQIDISKVVETNIRNYSKLQNLAAEIGGFLKICMLLFRLPLIFLSNKNLKARCIDKFLLGDKSRLARSKVNPLVELSKDGNKSNHNLMKNSVFGFSAKIKAKNKILGNLIWKGICSKKAKNVDKMLRAEEVIDEMLSVESIFKNKLEMDILKRFLLSKEQQVLLQIIREPNILDPKDEVASKLMLEKEESPSVHPAKEALKSKVKRNNTLTRFEEIIKDYL